MSEASGWFADPTGRHQFRFFDGTGWTEHVSDDGNPTVDPYDGEAPAPGRANDMLTTSAIPSAAEFDALGPAPRGPSKGSAKKAKTAGAKKRPGVMLWYRTTSRSGAGKMNREAALPMEKW